MHVAGSVEVLSRTGQAPHMIIVGIQSLNRERDLTPSHVGDFKESGGGPRVLDFIAQELMPYIDRNYRTTPTGCSKATRRRRARRLYAADGCDLALTEDRTSGGGPAAQVAGCS